MCAWDKCVSWCFGWTFCIYLLDAFSLKNGLSLLLPNWFSVWMTYSLLKVRYWTPLSIIVLLSICPFRSITICSIHLGAPILSVYIFIIIVISDKLIYLYINDIFIYQLYTMTFFVSYYCFCLTFYFVQYKYSYSYSFLVSTCMEYLFPCL